MELKEPARPLKMEAKQQAPSVPATTVLGSAASSSDAPSAKPAPDVQAAIEKLLEEEFGMSRFGRVMAMQFLQREDGSTTPSSSDSDSDAAAADATPAAAAAAATTVDADASPAASSSSSSSSAGSMERVHGWLLSRLNRKVPRGPSPWQRGCPEIIPKLAARALWDTRDAVRFPWIADLEAAFPVIREELLSLRGRGGFQPYRAPSGGGGAGKAAAPADGSAAGSSGGSGGADKGTDKTVLGVDGAGPRGKASHDAGDWNVFYIHLHNVDCAANRDLCPVTTALVDSIPRR